MTRVPNLLYEMTGKSRRLVAEAGIDLMKVQAYIDDPESKYDGASHVVDLCPPAEAVHDYLYATPNCGLTRRQADDLFLAIMLAQFEDEADWTSRFEGWALAHARWLAVRVFGNPALGLVTAYAWNPTRGRVWVP